MLNINRKLFFWMERLKINRAERRSVITLMILLLGLMFINALVEPKPPFERAEYAKIEKIFKQRTALLGRENKKLMAAYNGIPVSEVKLDSLPVEKIAKQKININKANIKLLDKLTGIGPAYAQNIIDYRNKNGPFTTKQELLKVRGIGEARLAKIKPHIVLGNVGHPAKTKKVVADSIKKTEAKITPKVKSITKTKLINVNTADAKTLETLPGIGEAYAQNIIEYRQQNGLFTAFKQLIKVKGIGKKRLEKLIPLIKLTDETE